ncbi:MAG TPA: hypothetical protein VFR68_15440 [Candidatus Dormibacteraeota bacterium]|nr:hypothetical protein [Candidatus Dormibacteraeota bacterium]
MIPVLIVIVLITIVAVVGLRWFARYRYTDAWRRSEFRGWAFGFLMWFGGLFGHRVPPPPQAKIEYATKDAPRDPPGSGGATFPDQASNEEQ